MPLHHLFDVTARHSGNLGLAIADDEPIFKIRGQSYLFDLTTGAIKLKFPVRYERPGWRLALSHDEGTCLVGCYEVYGLAGYSSKDGAELWRRKDLKSVQTVVASELEDWCFCGRESGSAHLLKSTTGETIEKFTGVKDLYVSPFDRSVIVAGKNLELHSPFGTKLAKFKRNTKIVFGCAFSPTEVVVNEPGLIRCFDLNTQELLWNSALIGDDHIPFIWFHETQGFFVGYNKASAHFQFFDPRSGRLMKEVPCSSGFGWVYSVCKRGSVVFDGNLTLMSVDTGERVQDFATPELIAWDPRARMERFQALAESGKSEDELIRYMTAEGFAKNDITRVVYMRYFHEKKKKAP